MLFIYLSMLESPEDKGKLEQIYNEYERLMLYVAYDILKDYHLAEDAVNDAFIRIINNFEKLFAKNDELICPRSKKLVVVITKNICIDMQRKKNRYLEQAIETDEGASVIDDIKQEPSAQDEYFQKYGVDRIKDAFSKLPENQKIALYYLSIINNTVEEIASILGEKPETIKKRIYRARKALRKILEENNE